MKKLTLIRHAKSSWENPLLDDIERPLNKRGEHDAPMMGKIISGKIGEPDLIISSPSIRTYETARIILSYLAPKLDIVRDGEVYHADHQVLRAYVSKIPSKFSNVILVGHNPGITELVNIFTKSKITNVPTCGILHIHFPVKEWAEIIAGSGELILFEFPKKYKQKS